VNKIMTFASILGTFVEILDLVVTLLMVVSVLGFVFGMVRFIYSAGDEKGRTEGKQVMVWGTLALFCMVAVWGLVRVIKTTFFG